MVSVLNPYDMMRDAQAWIGENWYILVVLAVLLGLIAIFMGDYMWREYMNIPAKERQFKRGKTSISNTIRQELLERLKKKKKRPF